MTQLEAFGLSKSFGGHPVLTGLDLTVPNRCIAAVLGPSGCGKTTLLRILAGFVDPDAGSVRFGDRTVVSTGRSVPPQHRRVGYVPQEGALFPHLTVGENIGFGLPRSQRRGKRLDSMLDLIELPRAFAHRRPHELSGGQQQRVALARALAAEPAVILLDEPFSSLDAGLREDTGRAVMNALRARHATAVLVTHDQGEALSLADQVAVMRDGRLAQVGAPQALYRAPADPAVARFVGGAALLAAEVKDGIAHCALGELVVTAAGAEQLDDAGQHEVAGPDSRPGAVRQMDVLVRPEQIRITDSGNEAAGVPAVVAEVSFYGHDAAVRLDVVPDGPRVVARVLGDETPVTGAVVRLAVHGPVTAFPATPGG
ncbi:MAG TPA: ABC transporter ATP-binding protein [Nocardioidaceae bacterium]